MTLNGSKRVGVCRKKSHRRDGPRSEWDGMGERGSSIVARTIVFSFFDSGSDPSMEPGLSPYLGESFPR